jgi:hypothetical protein
MLRLFFLTLHVFVNFAVASSQPKDRSQFKAYLENLSQQTIQNPMSCLESSLNKPAASAQYSFSLNDNPQYKDAFMILFSQKDGTHEFSTLVAYEGLNGYVMGSLDVKPGSDQTIYKHTFDGFFDDVTTLVVRQNKVVNFLYEKINPQGVAFYSLKCL